MAYPINCNCLSLQTSLFCQKPHTTTYTFVHPEPKFKSVSTKFSKTPDGEISFPRTPVTELPQIPSKIHPSSYSSLIQSCIDSNAFDLGKSVHAQMLSDENFRPGTFLQTKILMLYARSGDPNDMSIARQLFDEIPERNSTSWNTMILCYASKEDHAEVLEIFSQMHMSGIRPNKFTFPSVVKACVARGDECGVKQVHGLIIKNDLDCNLVVGGALVDGYVCFGSMNDAVNAFGEIDGKNTVAWNSVIGGYVRLMRYEDAWRAFWRIRTYLGLSPDEFTFATVTRICAALRSLDRGKQVHAQLVSNGFESSVFVGNSLIDMYAKCGDNRNCLLVFNSMKEKDQVTWNSVISSQAQLGLFENAVVLFKLMLKSGYKSNHFNLGSILKVSACSADSEMGRQVHSYLIRNLLETDVVLGSALVDMYSKSGCIEEARRTFYRLDERNEVSWNALLAGYVLEGQVEEALEHFRQMRLSNAQPDQYTFTSLLTLSADQGNEDQGKKIHAHIIRTIARQNIILETELVHMYARCQNLDYAQQIFDRMRERNAYSWNSLIVGCEQNGEAEKALELFHQMQLLGIKPDQFSLDSALSACGSLSDGKKGKQIHCYILRNALEKDPVLKCNLVDMYSKCGLIDQALKTYDRTKEKDVILHNIMIFAYVSRNKIDDARHIFDQMEERSTVSWNSMLTGYAKGGLFDEMARLFQRMLEESNELDGLTYLPMLEFCASIPAPSEGKQLHASLIKRGYTHTSVVLDSALVDMYAKGGDIEEARRLFDRMGHRNVITWNAMIAGYAKHGDGVEVLALFDQMKEEDIYPNDITFLSVLSACSHIGLIEEGLGIFISMIEEHGIEPRVEHYTCMVDLLGRAGHLDDAMEVIERMPIEPDVSTWGALLGACRVHQNVYLGRLAAERLFDLDPKNPGPYVLMSNIYAAAGRWKEANEVRNSMKSAGVTKDPGISWIEINNEIQRFHAGDRAHPKTDEIYATLKNLSLRMKGLGYVPNSSFVLRNIKDQEEYLLQHSERLAISLGLICLPENATIRIFKNLRICGDCHTVVKLISKITRRRIIVRDTKRFHHFEDGLCSCGDYW
ncbi:Pentatricopeptide repeat [Cinnamomum micranthum f. kanehirae]|uniref:Pentatricopeptide repeat n=1 Tax=Cinnamomum micranthum f. kanehirae TaxID=337451 RepID=A0A3S3PZ29_9MAGN|nr:Pentatricopeptide repeat [Cinnamomum micranthum f. kanehirae]